MEACIVDPPALRSLNSFMFPSEKFYVPYLKNFEFLRDHMNIVPLLMVTFISVGALDPVSMPLLDDLSDDADSVDISSPLLDSETDHNIVFVGMDDILSLTRHESHRTTQAVNCLFIMGFIILVFALYKFFNTLN